MKKCPVCGREFKPHYQRQKTCSRKCGQAYRTKEATIICPICKRSFVRSSPKRKFCSLPCYYKYRTGNKEIAEGLRRRRDFFASQQELERLYHGQQMTQDEIAAHFGCSQKKVWGLMRYYGITSRTAAKRYQNGALNSYWKGGRVRMGKYTYVSAPDHPNATQTGYVAEHILIATKALDRPLSSDECVHHLDGDKDHNAPDNLHVLTHKKHGQLHRQLETISLALYRAGLIIFQNGQYELTDKLIELAAQK